MVVMQHETHSLDYRAVPPVRRVRPRLWLSHMTTAAALCVFAVIVDHELRYDALNADPVVMIEVVLIAYGGTCAVVSMARGALTRRDKAVITACSLVFTVTAYVALLMPRVIHN